MKIRNRFIIFKSFLPKQHFMEHDDSSSLFNLSIDSTTKAHLGEAAKWARFLAIVGMVFLGLAVIGILFFAVYLTSMSNSSDNESGISNTFFNSGFGVGIALIYILLIGLWFFPLLFLLRFANKMKVALAGNDQQALHISVQNLKMSFRFVGIITIIILALYALGIVFGIAGAAFSFM